MVLVNINILRDYRQQYMQPKNKVVGIHGI
jgi:hypothetical protein